MKPRGAAMSKPDWANVAESAKALKSDWAHRTRGPGSFQYTVKGFLAADARFCDDEVTVTITVSDDGATRCSEPGCKAPDFGKSPVTRSEFATFKHTVAHHAPGTATIGVGPSGDSRRLKQTTLGGAFSATAEESQKQRLAARDARM